MNTILLIALVKMSVVSAFFIFAIFGISIFRDVFDWFPKIKHDIIPKQEKENKSNNKKTRCKTKTNQSYDSKQNKTTSRKKKKN